MTMGRADQRRGATEAETWRNYNQHAIPAKELTKHNKLIVEVTFRRM
jgi:hypothetical protein